ncbi:MAG: hypothetical protein V4526_02600 [Patescibacteria group bacterium]
MKMLESFLFSNSNIVLTSSTMAPHIMDIVSRTKALNLPIGQYCVFGSGVLEVHGIRKAKDIDILVNGELFKKLKKEGWKRKWFFWRTLWAKCITNGQNEAFTNLYWARKYRPNTQELINRAELHDGIPFLQLEDLLEFQRNLPREKDKRGVKMMEDYFASKK